MGGAVRGNLPFRAPRLSNAQLASLVHAGEQDTIIDKSASRVVYHGRAVRLGPCLFAWGAEHGLRNLLMRGLSPSAGTYDDLYPVPGHPVDGMHGRLVVS